eukprot:2575468-Prymnesium_polylepis.1
MRRRAGRSREVPHASSKTGRRAKRALVRRRVSARERTAEQQRRGTRATRLGVNKALFMNNEFEYGFSTIQTHD